MYIAEIASQSLLNMLLDLIYSKLRAMWEWLFPPKLKPKIELLSRATEERHPVIRQVINEYYPSHYTGRSLENWKYPWEPRELVKED